MKQSYDHSCEHVIMRAHVVTDVQKLLRVRMYVDVKVFAEVHKKAQSDITHFVSVTNVRILYVRLNIPCS